MKKNIHPNYRDVLFEDSSTGYRFVCGSTIKTNEKGVFEGVEYPLYRLPVSSASHPFFTGSKQLVDSEGRVDKFNKRYMQKNSKQAAETVNATSASDNEALQKTKKK